MTRRSMMVPTGIVTATVVAATVVLVAGGPDRVGLAMALLVGIPLLLVMGAGFDQGWRATSRREGPAPVRTRLVAYLPVMLADLAVLVLLARQTVTWAAEGDVVDTVTVVPFILLFGWRGWQYGRRLGATGQNGADTAG